MTSYTLIFHGGRRDGLEVPATKAPELIFISPEGTGIAPDSAYECPPVYVPYLRLGHPTGPGTVAYAEAEAA